MGQYQATRGGEWEGGGDGFGSGHLLLVKIKPCYKIVNNKFQDFFCIFLVVFKTFRLHCCIELLYLKETADLQIMYENFV